LPLVRPFIPASNQKANDYATFAWSVYHGPLINQWAGPTS